MTSPLLRRHVLRHYLIHKDVKVFFETKAYLEESANIEMLEERNNEMLLKYRSEPFVDRKDMADFFWMYAPVVDKVGIPPSPDECADVCIRAKVRTRLVDIKGQDV